MIFQRNRKFIAIDLLRLKKTKKFLQSIDTSYKNKNNEKQIKN